MKMFLSISITFVLGMSLAFAQTTLPSVPLTDGEVINLALASIGGEQTVGILGLVLVVVQCTMMACKGWLGNYLGKVKFLVVTGLTVVITIVAMKIYGASWMQAAMCSATLSALQVFIHQGIKQFITKEE